MKPIEAEASVRLPYGRDEAWARVVGAHVPDIMPGRGMLPGVTGICDATHPEWGVSPGQQRTLKLADGSTLRETVVAADRPARLDYRISDLTSAFGRLVSGADGRFEFTAEGDDATLVTWHYAYHPRSAITRPLSAFIIRGQWRAYMADVLRRLAG